MHLLAGIFVGGRATRMGGVAKGLLAAPGGEPIVVRTRRLLEEVGAHCVLVGVHPAYRDLGLETIADDSAATGPLAGILALLECAKERGADSAIAVACDMPFIAPGPLRRLVAAPVAPIVAVRRWAEEKGRDVWEPLFARYDPQVLPLARELAEKGMHKLQLLLDRAGARALELGPGEEATLIDWDTLPEDETRESKKE
ncbi:MAG: Molybdopterin-guanine dinucleotide biosynthesis protein MobA [Labilithrix sp.]|nr:Molybdopterin-guanine dinucleotide biosynthesis protein MobA [Labilithrix sp.]